MKHKVTFDKDDGLEATEENSNALAEGMAEALDRRHRIFLVGTLVTCLILLAVVTLIVHIITRYTGWAALGLGLTITVAYALGAVTGYDFATGALVVTYEPVRKG